MDFVFSIVSIVKLWSGNWATAVLFNEYKVAPLVACCPPLLTLESLFYAFMQPLNVSLQFLKNIQQLKVLCAADDGGVSELVP